MSVVPAGTEVKFIRGKDVYVLRTPHISHEGVEELARGLRQQNKKGSALSPEGALVLVLSPGMDLESLDENEMREHGWVRA